MNIYCSHSTSYDFRNELYKPLQDIFTKTDFKITFPHQDTDQLFPTKKFFDSGSCDLVIAEVSYPATGLGIELGWANMHNIPIICIHKKGTKPSSSLRAVSDTFITYESLEGITEELKTHCRTLLKG